MKKLPLSHGFTRRKRTAAMMTMAETGFRFLELYFQNVSGEGFIGVLNRFGPGEKKVNRKEEIIRDLKKNYKPIAPGKSFVIDLFKPEDAMGVIGCCYSIYGEGYPVDTYYIPEKLIEANQNGNIHGIVLRTPEGEVIGYAALYRSSGPYEKLYEAGQYIIQKEYRGTRAAFQMNARLGAYAKELDIDATYGECVTNHVITQKFGVRAGCLSTAIEIDLMPAEAYENDDRASGRVSALFQFLINKDKEQVLYIPEYYQERLEKTLNPATALKREITASSKGKKRSVSSKLKIEQFDFAGVGRFHAWEPGEDFETKFMEFEKRIEDKKYKVSQVFLSIADAGAIEIIGMLNRKGYFYGGYLPRWMDTDALLLQKLYFTPTFEGINLYPEGSQELLEFIRRDYKRIKEKRRI